jgi:Right handed beta helix region
MESGLLDAKRYHAITFALSRKSWTSTTRSASQAAAHLTMRLLDITTGAFLRGSATAVCLIIGICAANAQASQTWVSPFGHDSNPCSRTAACQTFAGAIAKTAAGGEIYALHPGDFGAVTITKAVTIDGGGGQVASLTVASGPGITVQAGPNDVVTLRNLRFNGLGQGVNGIRFQSGAALNIENCYISGFTDSGIEIASPGQANIKITDTVVHNNNSGIRIEANGAGRILVALLRVQINDNTWFGLRALGRGLGSSGQVSVSVTDSQAANNRYGIEAYGNFTSAEVIINRSVIINNVVDGLQTSDPGVIVVGDSIIAWNGTGVDTTTAGGPIFTNGNNLLTDNWLGDGTFTGPALLK